MTVAETIIPITPDKNDNNLGGCTRFESYGTKPSAPITEPMILIIHDIEANMTMMISMNFLMECSDFANIKYNLAMK